MKGIKYIINIFLTLTVAAVLAGCRDDILEFDNGRNGVIGYDSDGLLRISSDLEFPGMQSAGTRAMGAKPDYDNLQLYLLEFEEGVGLRQFQKFPSTAHQNDTQHGHNELVKFEVGLQPTDNRTVVHLVATNQPDFEQNITFGTEERVMSSLYTDNGYEAYWQRVDLGTFVPSKEMVEAGDVPQKMVEDIGAKLTHVPVIRNFCRVSVVVPESVKEHFQLTGLYVVNTVDRGTVAPYVASNEAGNRFVKYYKGSGSNIEGLSYDEVSAQNHVGFLATGVKLINSDLSNLQTKSLIETDPDGEVKPVYFYERPARPSETQRTYAIIRGKYRNSTQEEFDKDSFYKLDLGHIPNTNKGTAVGMFEYYNLLRNFDFQIIMNGVEEEGYESLEEASHSNVFNNFSAAVEARNIYSISDGVDMLRVNHIAFVFTQKNQTVDLEAQYREAINVNSRNINNELLKIEWEQGDVIKNIAPPEKFLDGFNEEWLRYKVEGNEPSPALKEQTVYLYRGNKAAPGEVPDYGLYRVIHFYSQNPWQFEMIETVPGLWEEYDQQPKWDWTDETKEIGSKKGSSLTLFFRLPPGIPQALFPLEFTIESDRQNIQNAYEGNAVVQSVPAEKSLFKDYPTSVTTNINKTRIQYVKTVTWDEYNEENTGDLVGTGNHMVRCRFVTITDLDNESSGALQTTTTLRVYNPSFGTYDEKTGTWFKYQDDTFVRNNQTSDPTPRVYDFSQPYWDTFLNEMEQRFNKTFRYLGDYYYTYVDKKTSLDKNEFNAAYNDHDGLTMVDATKAGQGEYTVTEYDIFGRATQNTYVSTLPIPLLHSSKDVNGYKYVVTDAGETGELEIRNVTINGRPTNTDSKEKRTLVKDCELQMDFLYGSGKERTMRLIVTSTNHPANNATPTPLQPKIVFKDVTRHTGVDGDDTPSYSMVGIDTSNCYDSYIYDITIPVRVKEFILSLQQPDDNTRMRFYRIEVIPRWDMFKQ